jgi:carbon monoxide dehydrogenase subunit G
VTRSDGRSNLTITSHSAGLHPGTAAGLRGRPSGYGGLVRPNLEVSARIRVGAAPERVWQVAMDWSRQGEWIPATQVHGGTGVGAQVVARTAVGPVGFTDTMIITEWDPPRRCVVRHTGRVVRGDGIFEVIPHGELTEFRWTELVELPLPAALQRGSARQATQFLGRWAVAPLARRSLQHALTRFARLV